MTAPVFTDFNFPYEGDEQIYDVIRLAVSLGYERVAVNTVITDLRGQKSKKQKEKIVIPQPQEVLLTEKSIASLQPAGKKLQQISRITTVLEDASNTHRLSSSDIQAYDIIAVQPTDDKTFQVACTTLDVDIIVLNFTENVRFPFKRHLVSLAMERGLHFEIMYSPALQDNSVKRNTISNALQFANICKGKKIILSSGASQPIHLRGPYDVINLAKVFGLSNIQAKDTITRNCRDLLLHAASRKSVKSVVSVKLANLLSKKEEWLLKMSTKGTDGDDDDDDDDSGEETSDSDEGDESSSKHEQDEAVNEPQRKKIKL